MSLVRIFMKQTLFGQIPSFYPDLLNICHPPKIVWTLWLFNFLILIWSFLQIFFTEYQVVERKNESIFFFYVYTWFNYDMCENISYSQCLLYVSWLSSYVWTVISYIVDYIFTSYRLRKYIQIVIQNWDWHCKIHKNILFLSSISFWITSALDFPDFLSLLIYHLMIDFSLMLQKQTIVLVIRSLWWDFRRIVITAC